MTFGGVTQETSSQKVEIQAHPPPMLVKGESVLIATQPGQDAYIEESKEPPGQSLIRVSKLEDSDLSG